MATLLRKNVITGNLVDWWEPKSKRRYLKKTRCIIDQYGNYTMEVRVVIMRLNSERLLVFRLMVRF